MSVKYLIELFSSNNYLKYNQSNSGNFSASIRGLIIVLNNTAITKQKYAQCSSRTVVCSIPEIGYQYPRAATDITTIQRGPSSAMLHRAWLIRYLPII